ncbi:MAG: hypothetical protein ACR2PG_17745 [Hyphomicrobiaceae bacterium]
MPKILRMIFAVAISGALCGATSAKPTDTFWAVPQTIAAENFKFGDTNFWTLAMTLKKEDGSVVAVARVCRGRAQTELMLFKSIVDLAIVQKASMAVAIRGGRSRQPPIPLIYFVDVLGHEFDRMFFHWRLDSQGNLVDDCATS